MIAHHLKDQALRTLFAAIISLSIFLILPGFQLLLGDDRKSRQGIVFDKKVVMEVKKKKQKEKKQEKKKLRKIQTRARALRTQTQKFSFAPDLGVEGDQPLGMNGENMENRIFDEGETDEPPVPIADPSPPYPLKARQLGLSGMVEITLIIDPAGRVASVAINKLPHPVFRESVLNTVRTWRFKPARMQGVPVNVRVKRKINYRLEG